MRDDGIVVQAIVTPGKMTLDDARANARQFEQLVDGVPSRLIVDMVVPYSTEPGVREFYASEEASRWVIALAMVTPSPASRIVGNFFLRLQHPPYPCRMFATTDEAAAWLLR